MHEHLIAPRPVRIASNPLLPYNNIRRSTAPHHIRPIKLVSPLSPPDPPLKQSLEQVDPLLEEHSPRSTPATPRSPGPLPAETLEEFLSILRPSVMPFHSLRVYSTSPMRQTFRSHTPRASITSLNCDTISETGSHEMPEMPALQEFKQATLGHDLDPMIPIWRSGGILSSPVCRDHTRNPFARRPSHENLALALSHNNPILVQHNYSIVSPEDPTPLSPSQIPLPPSTSPTPLSILQDSTDALVH